jgi:ubiquinone/menaquinone biosynthesis C-methylase UbiE
MNEVEKMKSAYAESGKNPHSSTTVRHGLFYDYPRFCVHQRETIVSRFLISVGLDVTSMKYKSFLDIGCGDGFTLREWLRLGARPSNCYGIDVIEERIKEAQYISPNMNFQVADAKKLPFPDKHFDVVTLYTVLSSVESEEGKKQILSESKRVAKNIILVYEQNETKNSERVFGVAKKELSRLSNIEWFFKDLIPEHKENMLYEDLAKLKTKNYRCYVALAKRR